MSTTEATGAYHRALVVSDGEKICIGDLRIMKSPSPGGYNISCFYDTSQSAVDGEIRYLDIDMDGRHVIFATPSIIYRVNIDGQTPVAQMIITTDDKITGLALDWLDGYVYWSTESHISMWTQLYELNIIDSDYNPRDIIVLPHDSKIMWISDSTSGSTSPYRVEQASMNGADRSTVLSTLRSPKSLAYDIHGNRIYWVEPGYIKSANMTGGDLQTLTTDVAMEPDLLLIYQGHVLWTQKKFSGSDIETVSLADPHFKQHSVTLTDLGVLQSIKVLDDVLQPMEQGGPHRGPSCWK